MANTSDSFPDSPLSENEIDAQMALFFNDAGEFKPSLETVVSLAEMVMTENREAMQARQELGITAQGLEKAKKQQDQADIDAAFAQIYVEEAIGGPGALEMLARFDPGLSCIELNTLRVAGLLPDRDTLA